jgi:hypothetical protein
LQFLELLVTLELLLLLEVQKFLELLVPLGILELLLDQQFLELLDLLLALWVLEPLSLH